MLDNYAIELRLWASDMGDQQRELRKRICMMNEYGHRVDELIALVDEIGEVAVRQIGDASPDIDYAVQQKIG